MPETDLRCIVFSLREMHENAGAAAMMSELRKRKSLKGGELAFVIELLEKSLARGSKKKKLVSKKAKIADVVGHPLEQKARIEFAAYRVAVLRDAGMRKSDALEFVARRTPDSHGYAMAPSTLERRIRSIKVRRGSLQWFAATIGLEVPKKKRINSARKNPSPQR